MASSAVPDPATGSVGARRHWWRRFGALHWRLTFFYTAVMAVLFGLLGLYLDHQLWDFAAAQMSYRVVARATALQSPFGAPKPLPAPRDFPRFLASRAGPVTPKGPLRLPVPVGLIASKVARSDSGGVTTTILSPQGDPVLPATGSAGAYQMRAGGYQTNLAPKMFHAALSSGQPVGPATVETAYGGFVIFEQPLGSPSRIEAVAQLATPTSEVDQLLSSFRMALILGLLGLFAAALVLGRPLARLALRPLRSLTAAVGSISPDLLEQRVALPGPADELRGLAQAFNQLLDRIEGSMRTQRLSQAQLQRFVGDASHELRSPLTALSGYVDLLLKPHGPAELQHVGPRMRREIDRMSHLVGDLLALTRLDAELDAPCSPEVLDLGQMADETVESMELLAEGRQLSIRRGDLELPVQGDRDSLERMLGNLVSNAIEHTEENGVIEVALARVDGWAQLRVTDDGEGMAPEHLGHIFDRFYRVDAARSRRRGNAGLGLAIVKAIAQQHGGSVEAASVLGQGSTFTIRLPLAPDTSAVR